MLDIMELFDSDYDSIDRKVEKNTAIMARSQARNTKALKNEIGSITLILLALIKSLIDRGIFTHEEFCIIIKELDVDDGIRDGKTSINKLKSILNFPKNKHNKRMIRKKSKKK